MAADEGVSYIGGHCTTLLVNYLETAKKENLYLNNNNYFFIISFRCYINILFSSPITLYILYMYYCFSVLLFQL